MEVRLKDKNTISVTPKDVELIAALSNGNNRTQAAKILKIKENTMDMRLRRLRLKMRLKTNYQVVATFFRNKLID